MNARNDQYQIFNFIHNQLKKMLLQKLWQLGGSQAKSPHIQWFQIQPNKLLSFNSSAVPQANDAYAPGHPHDVKENVIHQARPPSLIPPWSSSDGHLTIVSSGQGLVWALWPVGGYTVPYTASCDALTFLSEPAWTFSAICATVALLWDQTRQNWIFNKWQ